MHENLIAELAIVTVVAGTTGLIARRLGQPGILGYLLAGLVVGPYIPIPLFADPLRMKELAEVGVVLVMFSIGLEFRARRLLEVLPVSGLTAVAQMGTLAWAGFMVGSALEWPPIASGCLGATIAISSTMVVSAVLRTQPVDKDVRSHVFGILVVQDVVAIILMAVVTTLASGQNVGVQALAMLVAQVAGAVAVMLVIALLALPRLVKFALRQPDVEVLVVLVAGAAFGLAEAAEVFGYSVALGAFIAGMAVAESGRGHDVERAIESLRVLFSAIFFVSIGMSVDPIVAWSTLPLALVLCFIVVVFQFLSVSLGSVLSGSSLRRSVYSGLALGQIGELSFILATIGIGGGVLPKEVLPALVTVATITAFTTPLFLSKAQVVVETLDRRLPDKANQLLTAYHSFLRSLRGSDKSEALRKPALSVLMDWVALIVLFVARQSVATKVDPGLTLVVDGVAVTLAVPFMVGLIRSGRSLWSNARSIARGSSAGNRTRAVEALVLLAVVLTVGIPTLAIVRPLFEGPWVEATLFGLLVIALIMVGLRMSKVVESQTSGVELLAAELAEHIGDDSEPIARVTADSGPLAGLDYSPLQVPAGSSADGRSLAELDIRCKTGATVLALCRGDATITLPTGTQLLRENDVLAVSGSSEALARARELLAPTTPLPYSPERDRL